MWLRTGLTYEIVLVQGYILDASAAGRHSVPRTQIEVFGRVVVRPVSVARPIRSAQGEVQADQSLAVVFERPFRDGEGWGRRDGVIAGERYASRL